uniref:Uncharacterized protein n=1 Tax=Caenorhabditis japonica TaxID=281687 RepID=A0A8R1IDQ8_CAEJA
MDSLLARLKLGSKRKKKAVSAKKARPTDIGGRQREPSGSIYSDLTASSSTVSAVSTPADREVVTLPVPTKVVSERVEEHQNVRKEEQRTEEDGK